MPGTTVTVAEVEDENRELLCYLADLGLVPGAQVVVLAKGPFGGPLHVRVDGKEYALGEAVTEAVAVLPWMRPKDGGRTQDSRSQ